MYGGVYGIYAIVYYRLWTHKCFPSHVINRAVLIREKCNIGERLKFNPLTP